MKKKMTETEYLLSTKANRKALMIKKPKKWGEMSDHERREYANKKKADYEKKLAFITRVCQKLSSNKDLTTIEMERIDLMDLK